MIICLHKGDLSNISYPSDHWALFEKHLLPERVQLCQKYGKQIDQKCIIEDGELPPGITPEDSAIVMSIKQEMHCRSSQPKRQKKKRSVADKDIEEENAKRASAVLCNLLAKSWGWPTVHKILLFAVSMWVSCGNAPFDVDSEPTHVQTEEDQQTLDVLEKVGSIYGNVSEYIEQVKTFKRSIFEVCVIL